MTALDTKALLPCPFCGEAWISAVQDGGPCPIVCPDCGAEMPYMSQDEPQSVRWNTRSAPRLARRVIALEEALRPFAELAGGDVNMNDPLRKWITVGQLWEARAALKGEGDE